MKPVHFAVILPITLCLCVGQDPTPQQKLELRVLYAGDPTSARATEWREFLGGAVEKVGFADIASFTENDADGFDVVVFDTPPPFDAEGGFAPRKVAELPADWSRPTVALGHAAEMILRERQSGLDRLWLCLGNAAHGLDAAHEIFSKPFHVEPTLTEVETPGNYRKYREGATLPPKIPVWVVHSELGSRDFGLVSDPYGFADSPDCESISSGLNSKGPRSVALGRQGNFFLWGFCAPPSALTEEARKVFLNTLVYMKRFDGRRPLHRHVASGREWLVEYAWFMQNGSDSDHLRKRIDPDLLATGPELLATVERDLEFVRVDGEVFRIDEDAKALKLSNRDPRILDVCVDSLEKDRDDARALRVLRRYTGQSFDDAEEWRAWWVKFRMALYFSDTAGYRYFVDPAKAGIVADDDDADGGDEHGKDEAEREQERERESAERRKK